MTTTEHVVIVELKIIEFEKGEEVNRFNWHSRGDMDYLATAARIIEVFGTKEVV